MMIPNGPGSQVKVMDLLLVDCVCAVGHFTSSRSQ